MTSSPILRVLSTFSVRGTRAILMGGQACILYGAAEFSRDVDWAVDPVPENLDALREALAALPAEPVFVPPLSSEVLRRGHACHFRSAAPEDHGLHIHILSVMRGVDPFPALWERRVELELLGAGRIAVLALPDLVLSKKTQRDKDWPMVRRLIEADALRHGASPPPGRVEFWLSEARSPELLRDLAARHPVEAAEVSRRRPALAAVLAGDLPAAARALAEEERSERERDREYWAPLRAELERWRFEARGDSGT
ncbi:MAG: hypothetical protein HY720_24075 [Planctomycetes bacterium]|nr:hypothetical protein [Planctomycetota bacterium]